MVVDDLAVVNEETELPIESGQELMLCCIETRAGNGLLEALPDPVELILFCF